MTLSIILICWLSFSANLDEVKNPCAENQEKKRFIEAPVAFFDLDRLGRICVVDTNNFISIYEQDGNKKYNFARLDKRDLLHKLKDMNSNIQKNKEIKEKMDRLYIPCCKYK